MIYDILKIENDNYYQLEAPMDCCKRDTKLISRLYKRVSSFICQRKKGYAVLKNATGRIVLVGSPNVGKSLIFNCLTGKYAEVSNYPGTTVEVYRGKTIVNQKEYEIIDTPGMYSLLPISEEELVARNYLLKEKSDIVVHVIDAKNVERMLPFTIQLIESGLRVVLVLNMMDEAESLGMVFDVKTLSNKLGIPVVKTVAALNKGIDSLKERLGDYVETVA